MVEYYNINEKLNYFKDLRWEDLSLYEKTAIADSILDISLLSKNFYISVREEGVIRGELDSLSKAQHDRDEISSMIIIKMTLQSFEDSPWLSLHQLIHYFKSKGGDRKSVV